MALTTPTPAADPFDPRWSDPVLAELADRAADETGLDRTRRELFELLWPWAQRKATSLAWRTPSGADRAELRSQVLTAVWQACQRFDPDRWSTWPALLHRRVEGARLDAARHDDPMSRGARRRITAARAAAGPGATPAGSAPEVVEVELVELDQADPVDGRWDPALRFDREELHEALRSWLTEDLPPALAARVGRWLDRSAARGPLPLTLEREIRPYLGRLVPFFFAEDEIDPEATALVDDDRLPEQLAQGTDRAWS